MHASSPRTTESPSTLQLLTVQDVAELLSFSKHTIRDWAESGKLASIKIGGQLRFRLADVEALVATAAA